MKDLLQGTIFVGAFLVLFIPLLVTDSMFFPYITGKNFAFRILVEVIFTAWVLLALLDVRYRPRFSWIMVSGALLLLIMFFADLFGQYPVRSFWSNFERMDGFITLVHFYMYFVVLGHMFRSEKIWTYFFNTSIGVATYVAITGLALDDGRITSTLGNATYLAVYMLFNLFLLSYLFLHTRTNLLKWLYAILGLLFVYVLLETGTRGTFIGLVTGTFVAIAYMSLFARGYPQVRKIAIGGVILMIIAGTSFFLLRDSQLVQSRSSMARIANISLEDLTVRGTIWSLAWEGVKERPILGWGQGGFNYVFNEHYDPSLYDQEAWFDRVHNIFFDWLIAGGVLGFIAYFSILISCLYYLFWIPLFKRKEDTSEQDFTVLERALLLGVLAGYFTHNLVVFDNIVSYMYYAVILAFIHSRVAPALTEPRIEPLDSKLVTNIFAPVAGVLLVIVIYTVHLPAIFAAQDMIDALKSTNIEDRFSYLEKALERDTFARQEIVEQMNQQVLQIVASPDIPVETKQKYLVVVETALRELIDDKPGDARLHVLYSTLYKSAGQLELAKEQIDIAHELSPGKQVLIIEQGALAAADGDYETMRDRFKEAFLLDQNYDTARYLYASSLIYTGETDKISEIITEDHKSGFATDPNVLRAAERTDSKEILIDIMEERIRLEPDNAQHRASLASVYYEDGQIDEAVAVLEEASREIPAFASLGQCYIDSMQSGEDPRVACQP